MKNFECENKLENKIYKAHCIYVEIMNKKLPYKFKYLEDWRFLEANILLNEANKMENNLYSNNKINFNYWKFKRGTLLQANFGIGLGSEMSEVHFAIVISNFDNLKNDVITVIPLTSKSGKFNLDLGELISEKLNKKIKLEMESCLLMNIEDSEYKEKMEKINKLTSYYNLEKRKTYACCSLVTTISKSRVLKPVNEYDIIGRTICNSEIMDKIDEETINRFISKEIDIKR